MWRMKRGKREASSGQVPELPASVWRNEKIHDHWHEYTPPDCECDYRASDGRKSKDFSDDSKTDDPAEMSKSEQDPGHHRE